MILSQNGPRWQKKQLGKSPYTIGDVGCYITCLAEILGTTPNVVNERLLAVNGYASDSQGYLDLVLWSKILAAFPGVTATFYKPYNNAIVLQNLANGNSIITTVTATPIGGVGTHAVRYIGGGKLHDPWQGRERPTSDFGTPYSFVVISGKWNNPPPPSPEDPVLTYKLPKSVFEGLVTASTNYKELLAALNLDPALEKQAKSYEKVLEYLQWLINDQAVRHNPVNPTSPLPTPNKKEESPSKEAKSIWRTDLLDVLREMLGTMKKGEK